MVPYDLLNLQQCNSLLASLSGLSAPDAFALGQLKRQAWASATVRADREGLPNWNWWWHDVSNALRLDDGALKVTVVTDDLYPTGQIRLLVRDAYAQSAVSFMTSLELAYESLERYAIALRDGQTVGRAHKRTYARISKQEVDDLVAYLRGGSVERARVISKLQVGLMSKAWSDERSLVKPLGAPLHLTVDTQQTLEGGSTLTLRSINLFKNEEVGRHEVTWAQLEKTLLTHAYDEIPVGSGNWIEKPRSFV